VRQERTQLMFLKYELGSKFPTLISELRAMEARGATAQELALKISDVFEKPEPWARAGHGAAAQAISVLPHESTATSTVPGSNTTLNQQTTISVTAPNAEAAAHRVGAEQTRVNQQMFHHAQNARR